MKQSLNPGGEIGQLDLSPNRHGKIACLPRELREEVNRRLEEGQSGVKILAWLNAHPDVRPVLEREFGGRAINLVNLSAWRRGGFQEWRRLRFATQEIDRQMRESSGAGAAFLEITDALAREFAIEMKTALQRALDASKNPIEKWNYLQQGLREINALRMYDIREQGRELTYLKRVHRAARLARQQELTCGERFDGSGQIKADKGEKNEHPTSNIERSNIANGATLTPSLSHPMGEGELSVWPGCAGASVVRDATGQSAQPAQNAEFDLSRSHQAPSNPIKADKGEKNNVEGIGFTVSQTFRSNNGTRVECVPTAFPRATREMDRARDVMAEVLNEVFGGKNGSIVANRT